MGICLVAQTLSDAKIAAIMADPPLVWRLVSPDDNEFYLEETGQTSPPGFLSKLFGKPREWPPKIPDFVYAENEFHELDMDKAWDGVNFCLKRLIQAGECPNFFADGRPVGKVEVGYGPAMCFSSDEISKIAGKYAAISESDLLAQYVPAQMKEVYPDALWSRGDDDSRQYLTENFAALKTFLELAAKYRLAVLIQYT